LIVDMGMPVAWASLRRLYPASRRASDARQRQRRDVYFYYICRGRQNHTCNLPYLPVADVEDAVTDHYVTVTLSAELRERMHRGVDNALADTAATTTS
jgi:hypothetical protein